ncbi:hypothetical protein HY407_04430 [Candidatus Gottesmanbacteria bacterium]|nr:hypothetical protein [Candidatus Gottesmanbacteria bacterium]
MKIIQETENQLVAKQSNIGNILFGMIFVFMGIGVNILALGIITFIIGISFFLAGVYIIMSSKSAKITLSRLTKNLTIEYVGFRYKKVLDIKFDEIKEVAIEQYIFDSMIYTGPRSPQEINLIICLKNDEEILVNAGESGNTYILGVQLQKGLINIKDKNLEIANKISDFIGVPFTDRRGKTLREGFSNYELRLKTK